MGWRVSVKCLLFGRGGWGFVEVVFVSLGGSVVEMEGDTRFCCFLVFLVFSVGMVGYILGFKCINVYVYRSRF